MAETQQNAPALPAHDPPGVACALAVDATIWTHDKSLAKECGVPSITTAQLRAQYPL